MSRTYSSMNREDLAVEVARGAYIYNVIWHGFGSVQSMAVAADNSDQAKAKAKAWSSGRHTTNMTARRVATNTNNH